jgi:hypothetical protein
MSDVIYKTRENAARSSPRPAAPPSPDRSRRKPLGLKPVGEPDPAPERELSTYEPTVYRSLLEGVSEERRSNVVTLEFVYKCLDDVLPLIIEGAEASKERDADQRREIAELKLAHGKLVNENTALRLILENLRISVELMAIEVRPAEMGVTALRALLGLEATKATRASPVRRLRPGSSTKAILLRCRSWPTAATGQHCTCERCLRAIITRRRGSRMPTSFRPRRRREKRPRERSRPAILRSDGQPKGPRRPT